MKFSTLRPARLIFLITVFFSILIVSGYSQNIAITDDDGYAADPSAMLDVQSSDKGMLVPRMTSTQRNLINSPATGLLVFDTNEGSFFFYNGYQWVNLSNGGDVWTKNGNNVSLNDSSGYVGVGTNSPNNKFIVQGNPEASIDEAIFAVVSPNGDTLFAVYPEGTRVYVNDDAAKAVGSKGGFAVGGFSTAKGTPTNEYLRVTPDSVRVYIDDPATAKASGSKGGFAVGGFSTAKAAGDSLYLFSDPYGLNVNYMSQTEIDAIVDPRVSSIVFNTTDSCLQIYLGYWENIWCTPLGCVYPIITAHPVNYEVIGATDTAYFNISATGSKLHYKWQESRDGGETWTMLNNGGTNPNYTGVYTESLVLTNIPEDYYGYKYRCHISNACETGLSNEAELIVYSLFSDPRDGQVYKTRQFGDQIWMVENLRATKYPDGTPIPYVSDDTEWANLADNNTDDAYCWNMNDSVTYAATYGALYTWSAAMGDNAISSSSNPSGVQGVCPDGWHLPSDDEWKDLEMENGMTQAQADNTGSRGTNEGSKLAGNNELWDNGLLESDIEFGKSGFLALPGGSRNYFNGTSGGFGQNGNWWTTTEGDASNSYNRYLYYDSEKISRNWGYPKSYGFSVRCVKN